MSSANDHTDDTGVSLHYYESLDALFYATTALSLITNLLVCLFHGGLTFFYRVIELNRISLRLIVLSAIFEVIRATFRLAMIVPANTVTCAADSFFVSWSNVASSLCLALVGVHTVCVLVLNVDNPLRLEKYYYATIFLYSTIVCGVAARHTPIGYLHQFYCWIRFYFGKKTINEFEWTWYFTALMIPIAVASICCLILLIRYKMERYNFVETSVRYARNNTNAVLPVLANRFRHVDPIKIFRNVIIRSFFYALIPLISKLSFIISGFQSLLSLPVVYKSLIASSVLTNVQGVLISILYFTDPAVIYTVKRFGHFLRKVYVDDYYLARDKSSDTSPSPPDSFDDRMRQRFGPDFGETEHGDWGPAIQLTPIHHDMIAEDTTEDRPFYSTGASTDQQRQRRRRSSAHLWGKSYTKPPWDPYYNQYLAKSMHWMLTRVCRLKPLPFAESSSTLSYQSYVLASHNSLPMSTNDAGEQQQQPVYDDMTSSISVTTSDVDIKGDGTDKIDQPIQMDDNDKGEKDITDRQGGNRMADPSTSMHPSSDGQHLQFLMPPITTTAGKATKASSSPPWASPGHTEQTPPRSVGSSDEEKSSGSNKGTISSGSPLSSLRIARQSKKLGLGILHHRHENNSASESHQQQFTPMPSPSSSADHMPSPSIDSLPSSKQSSFHLSQTSSLHLPQTSSSDIDHLSLLSSVESASNKGYEPLTAPSYHYHTHRRRHSYRRRRQRRSRKRASNDTSLPSLSITLAGENEHHQGQVPLTASATPPSSASDASSTTASSSSMEPIPSRHLSAPKHGVKLQPSVLKALLLDWEPPHPPHQHLHLDPSLLKPDGLEDGWTTIIHIGQAWDSTLNVASSSSSSSSSSGSLGTPGFSTKDSHRIVSFVEHWFRGYIGSRWFVVE